MNDISDLSDEEIIKASPLDLRQFEDVLRMSEIADILRVDAKTVTRWCNQGKLVSFRTVGGHRRVKKVDFVKALITAQTAKWSDETEDEYHGRTGMARSGDAGTRSPEPEVAAPRTRTKSDRQVRRGNTEHLIVVDSA